MDEKKYLNAKRAIGIVTTLTFLVAFFELLFAFTQYQQGMTIGDVVSYVTNKHHIYLWNSLLELNILFRLTHIV